MPSARIKPRKLCYVFTLSNRNNATKAITKHNEAQKRPNLTFVRFAPSPFQRTGIASLGDSVTLWLGDFADCLAPSPFQRTGIVW